MADDAPVWAQLLAVGAAAAAAIAIGMGLGWAVDSAADTGPAFLMVGLALGIVAAVWYTVSQFRTLLRSQTPHPHDER